MNFSNVVGGLEGLMLVPARNRGLSDGIITAAFQEKAEEMDPTFLPRPPRKQLLPVADIESPEPLDRRHDAQGRFLPRWRRRRDDAQGLAEYALMLALVVIIAIASLTFLGGGLASLLDSIGQAV